jgi:hypothetical protein
MKKLCCLGLLLSSSLAFAAPGPDAATSQEGNGCFYDGKLYSEGALVSVRATNYIVIRCDRRQPEKDKGSGFVWRMLGVQTKAGAEIGKKQ